MTRPRLARIHPIQPLHPLPELNPFCWPDDFAYKEQPPSWIVTTFNQMRAAEVSLENMGSFARNLVIGTTYYEQRLANLADALFSDDLEFHLMFASGHLTRALREGEPIPGSRNHYEDALLAVRKELSAAHKWPIDAIFAMLKRHQLYETVDQAHFAIHGLDNRNPLLDYHIMRVNTPPSECYGLLARCSSDDHYFSPEQIFQSYARLSKAKPDYIQGFQGEISRVARLFRKDGLSVDTAAHVLMGENYRPRAILKLLGGMGYTQKDVIAGLAKATAKFTEENDHLFGGKLRHISADD